MDELRRLEEIHERVFARDTPLDPSTKVLTSNMRPAEIVETKENYYRVKILNRSGPLNPDRRHFETNRKWVYYQRETSSIGEF